MKRLVTVFLLVAMLSVLAVPSVSATEDLNQTFEEALWLLDGGFGFELNPVYMHFVVSREISQNNMDDMGPFCVPAEEYEQILYQYFAVSDAQLQQIRTAETEYDATNQTYTFEYYGGFGGAPASFGYLGYVTSGDGYDLYSIGYDHTYLDTKFESYEAYEAFMESMGWADSVTYEGVLYEGSMGDYVASVELDSGRKYHVQLNDGVVKFISCTTFERGELPEKFEPIAPNVTVTLPADGSVTLPDTDNIFADGTEVTVAVVMDTAVVDTAKAALAEIATEFVVYDFSAVKDSQPAQPNGDLKVVFTIPNGFSDDVSVYYMDHAGNLELLNSTVSEDGKTVTVTLTHFSKYILVDNFTKPSPAPTPSEPTVPSEPTEPSVPATQPAGTTANTQENVPGGNTPGNDASGEDDNQLLLWFIIIAGVAMLGCIAAVVAILVRKKK